MGDPGAMTRIILQRSFLLLAFTGILLSGAQESTSSPSVPPVTDLRPSGSAPPSAPESSSAETVSPHSDDPVGRISGSTSPTFASEKSSPGGESSTDREKSDESPTDSVEFTVGHSEGLLRDETPSQTSSFGASTVAIGHSTDVEPGHGPSVSSQVTEAPGKDANRTVDESTPDSSSDDPAPSTVPSRSSDAVDSDRVSTVQSDGPATRTLNDTRASTDDDAADLDASSPKGTEDGSAGRQENGSNWTVSPSEAPTSPTTDGSGKKKMATEVTYEMDGAASSPHVAAIFSERVEDLALDTTSRPPMSSAALPSLGEKEDSIHLITTTAQILDASTAPSLGGSSRTALPKATDFVGQPESLVTFDPDGMTHNSSQEPDAVTFTPVTFRASTEGGRSTDASERRPSVLPGSIKFTDDTTHVFELLEANMKGEDREREPPSSVSGDHWPHDEPDREELSSKNTLTSTRLPPSVATGVVRPANDESEEMMNDSPQFGPIQSKPTTRHDKEPEGGVSNHIGHLTQSTTRELGSSTDHQSDQSEFRPVTAPSSHLKDSDTSRPDQTESVSSTISKVLPHPANQSEAATTEGGPASSIAGVAVKTSVSVNLPLSNAPGGSNSPVGSDDAILPNITGILPFPIHLDPKESGVQASPPSMDAPGTTEGGLRIRKPKLKIGGGTEGPADSTPRTRKPFLAPPQRSSTTVGPPVSIFKKSRTRGASITSSTTARPFPNFSTIRIQYASRMPGMVPGGELVFSMEPVTTTVPTTTETEEPFSDEPFTDPTQGPVVPPNEDAITLVKVAGCLTVDRGLRWHEQLNNRHSPLYREKANYVQIQLERLFRTSPIASQVWKIQIDGFSGRRQSRSVVIDFFLYLIKSRNEISTNQLTLVFHDKLVNNTFSRFTVDPSKTTFEFLNEEPMRPPTEAPESSEPEPVLPQWAIAVIVVGAASLIFIVLFAVVAILGRHHMRRRYSSKLNEEDSDRPGDWETKMAAAYENLAADTIYDAEDLHSDTYKKKNNATYHGRPSKPQRADSWSSSDWSPPPRRPRPQVHRIVY